MGLQVPRSAGFCSGRECISIVVLTGGKIAQWAGFSFSRTRRCVGPQQYPKLPEMRSVSATERRNAFRKLHSVNSTKHLTSASKTVSRVSSSTRGEPSRTDSGHALLIDLGNGGRAVLTRRRGRFLGASLSGCPIIRIQDLDGFSGLVACDTITRVDWEER